MDLPLKSLAVNITINAMKYIKSFAPWIVSGSIFILVVLNFEPPKSLKEASFLQLGLFFIPLLGFFTSVINIYYKSWVISLPLGLGLTILVVLKGLGILTILSGFIVISASLFIGKIIRKKSSPANKIPKLANISKRR